MNNDSSMWGTYADNHRGVCLIYETDEENPEVEELDLEKRLMAIDDEVLTVKGVATLTLNPNGWLAHPRSTNRVL